MKVKMIYLAAGNSRRFCISEGKRTNKLLYPFHGKPLYQHGLDALIQATEQMEDTKIYVVTQYREIYEYAKEKEGLIAVFSPESRQGMSYTIRNGLKAAGQEKESCYYLFLTADQPFITPDTIRGLIDGVREQGKSLGTVMCDGVPGNPAIFHDRYDGELMKLTGDQGGRRILKVHPEEVWQYQMTNPKELKDFDYFEEMLEESR